MAGYVGPGHAGEAEIRSSIETYVQALKAAGAIRSAPVERAFRTVQRHRLVETFYHRGEHGRVTVRHDPERPRREDLEGHLRGDGAGDTPFRRDADQFEFGAFTGRRDD